MLYRDRPHTEKSCQTALTAHSYRSHPSNRPPLPGCGPPQQCGSDRRLWPHVGTAAPEPPRRRQKPAAITAGSTTLPSILTRRPARAVARTDRSRRRHPQRCARRPGARCPPSAPASPGSRSAAAPPARGVSARPAQEQAAEPGRRHGQARPPFAGRGPHPASRGSRLRGVRATRPTSPASSRVPSCALHSIPAHPSAPRTQSPELPRPAARDKHPAKMPPPGRLQQAHGKTNSGHRGSPHLDE